MKCCLYAIEATLIFLVLPRDSKDNELWEFKGYFSKIADLPPNILSEFKKNWIEKAKMRTIS